MQVCVAELLVRMSVVLLLLMTGAAQSMSPPTLLQQPNDQQDMCSTMRYAEVCLQHDACAFCCGAPIGQQCVNRTSAGYRLCPSAHLLEPNTSAVATPLRQCRDLCPAVGGTNCSTCVGMLWCYYCYTSGHCISPQDPCLDGTVLQTCVSSVPNSNGGGSSSSDADDAWYHAVVYTSITAAAILLVMALVLVGQRCRMRVVLGRLLRQETRPLLSPTNGQDQQATMSTDDGERRRPTAASADATDEATANASSVQEHQSHQGTELTPSAVVARNTSVNSTSAPAAAAAAASTAAEASSTNHGADGEGVDVEASTVSSASDGMCQLCFETQAEVAFLPCYHVHCCTRCANKIRPNRVTRSELNCPFCRQRIQAMVRLTSIVHKKVA